MRNIRFESAQKATLSYEIGRNTTGWMAFCLIISINLDEKPYMISGAGHLSRTLCPAARSYRKVHLEAPGELLRRLVVLVASLLRVQPLVGVVVNPLKTIKKQRGFQGPRVRHAGQLSP